jgi:hypothetical protein
VLPASLFSGCISCGISELGGREAQERRAEGGDGVNLWSGDAATFCFLSGGVCVTIPASACRFGIITSLAVAGSDHVTLVDFAWGAAFVTKRLWGDCLGDLAMTSAFAGVAGAATGMAPVFGCGAASAAGDGMGAASVVTPFGNGSGPAGAAFGAVVVGAAAKGPPVFTARGGVAGVAPVFGGAAAAKGPPVFGGGVMAPVFGGADAAKGPPVFGGVMPPIFGGAAKGPPVFGGVTAPVFGGAAAEGPPVFGGGMPPVFGGAAAKGPPVFGGVMAAPVFGGAAAAKGPPVFGGVMAPVFGGWIMAPVFGRVDELTGVRKSSLEVQFHAIKYT